MNASISRDAIIHEIENVLLSLDVNHYGDAPAVKAELQQHLQILISLAYRHGLIDDRLRSIYEKRSRTDEL